MAKFINVDELEKKVKENCYSIENDAGFPDDGMSDVDIYNTIDECKQYEFELPCTEKE